jgi:hypothetical protein
VQCITINVGIFNISADSDIFGEVRDARLKFE